MTQEQKQTLEQIEEIASNDFDRLDDYCEEINNTEGE